MDKMNTFQLIVLGSFIVLAAIGVLAFAFFAGTGGQSFQRVVIWGTMSQRTMDLYLGELKRNRDELEEVEYVEKDARTYNEELIEAIAEGRGPDLIVLAHEDLVRQEDKLLLIPFDSFSERDFKNTFIEEGELFLTTEGLYGIPFTVDPLVMYWNRDLFSTEAISEPPQYWDEFFGLAEKLTKRDEAQNIIQSTVAFGEYRNVEHAKEIISALMMQAGTPITSRTTTGVNVVLQDRFEFATPPAQAAMLFFTEFSNPVKTVYSWNRALPNSKQAFLSGDLAMYFGPASEAVELQTLNPNLNFDIAALPQSRGSGKSLTYGDMMAFAIPRGSQNIEGALLTAVSLTDAGALTALHERNGLPPVRRDLLRSIPNDAYRNITYTSALVASGWLDPDSSQSDTIFRDMVESITSGRERISTAVGIADKQLENLAPGN